MAVAAGGNHSQGLKTDRSIVAWGRNDYGQTNVPAPNSGFVAVAAGGWHSLGLKADGSIVAWGNNDYGQTNVPVLNSGFIAVAAGGWHSLGLKGDGSIVAWGDNSQGQTTVPAPNSGFAAVAGGGYHSLGVKALAAPQPDLSGIKKSRFISFSVPPSGGDTALRATLSSLHHVNPPYTGGASVPFTAFEGQVRWVGPPTQYIESNSNPIPFHASFLQCAPEYRDWSTVGLIHVTGSAIVPSSSYDVENLAASCAGNEANCAAVSAPLTITTTRWGDIVEPYNPPDPSSQPDFGDIGALVNKFKSAVGAPIKARAMLAGEGARGLINITPDLGFGHISACVDGFKGLAYPYKVGKCTGAQTTACTTDADCGANGPCILCP